MKRYEGSRLIGYRAPKFDEYLLPMGPPSAIDPPAYEKSAKVEGQVSYYTYVALAGRTPAELFLIRGRNFRDWESTLYEKSRRTTRLVRADPDKIAEEVGGCPD